MRPSSIVIDTSCRGLSRLPSIRRPAWMMTAAFPVTATDQQQIVVTIMPSRIAMSFGKVGVLESLVDQEVELMESTASGETCDVCSPWQMRQINLHHDAYNIKVLTRST